jgi:hypothetical protein
MKGLLMATTKRTHQRSKKRHQNRVPTRVAERYEAEAKEINAAKQAMRRIRREVEFEPERLHYVISL